MAIYDEKLMSNMAENIKKWYTTYYLPLVLFVKQLIFQMGIKTFCMSFYAISQDVCAFLKT